MRKQKERRRAGDTGLVINSRETWATLRVKLPDKSDHKTNSFKTVSHTASKAGPKLTSILLLLPPKCRDYTLSYHTPKNKLEQSEC